MIMRKSPRNDVENPPGQLVWCECGDRLREKCPGEWEPGCDMGANEEHVKREEALQEMVRINEELGLYDDFLPVNQGKPLVKELSEYEEIVRKNNSEHLR